MEKKLIATYEMVKNYKNKPTNYWLAIGEFIDNSISSYQEKNLDAPIIGLVINIVFDFQDERNKKIIISDNAKGMSEEEILEAAQPYRTQGKSNNQYNQFGIGMKLGIFWYGEDGHIYSKQKNSLEYYLDFSTSNKKDDEEIILHTTQSFNNRVQYESGTTIEIQNVYDNRCFAEKGFLDKFKDALGWRYNKLIDKGLLIKVTFKRSDAKASENCDFEKIYSYSNKPFKKEQLLALSKKYSSTETINQRKIILNDEIKKLEAQYNLLKDNKDNELTRDAINKFLNNEEMVFERTFIVNNRDVNLKFAIINANRARKIQYSGVTIYHCDRAIMHGPNDKYMSNFMFKELSINSVGDPKYRWLYGEMNLTGIEIPDENKSKFNWSAHGYAEILKELSEIFGAMDCILKAIVAVDQCVDTKKSNSDQIKNVKNDMQDKFNEKFFNWNIIDNIDGNKSICTNFILQNDETWNIEIFEDYNKSFDFLKQKFNEQDKTIIIGIDANHIFWKPLINQQDFKGKLLYPICLMLSISDYLYNNTETTNIFDENKDKTFIEIISKIVYEFTRK